MRKKGLVDYTEETQAVGGRSVRRGGRHGRRVVRAGSAVLFLLSSFPLGLFWFVVLITLLLVGLALTIVWVGLPILALAFALCIVGAGTERWRLAALLGAQVDSPRLELLEFRPDRRGRGHALPFLLHSSCSIPLRSRKRSCQRPPCRHAYPDMQRLARR